MTIEELYGRALEAGLNPANVELRMPDDLPIVSAAFVKNKDLMSPSMHGAAVYLSDEVDD